MGTIAVTGCTGKVGGRVAGRLAQRGVPQVLCVRDPARAPDLPGAEVAVAAGYDDHDAMRRAFEGVTSLFLVSGRETEDRLSQHRSAVDAARDAGVEHVVYLSFLNAAPDATFTLARQHHETERMIREAGFVFTFLRDSLYADFVPFFTGSDGVIRGPAGDGTVSWIGRDDIAEVAATVLAEPGHEGATYDVTGPAALSLTETAVVLSGVTGRTIAFQEETIEEAWASRRPSGAPDWEIEGWITSYQAIAMGEMSTVSDDVERITGVPPEALEPFLRRRPELWQHLTEPRRSDER